MARARRTVRAPSRARRIRDHQAPRALRYPRATPPRARRVPAHTQPPRARARAPPPRDELLERSNRPAKNERGGGRARPRRGAHRIVASPPCRRPTVATTAPLSGSRRGLAPTTSTRPGTRRMSFPWKKLRSRRSARRGSGGRSALTQPRGFAHHESRLRAPPATSVSRPRRIGETTYALFASSSEESQRHSSLTCLRISGFETNYASRAPDFLRDLKQLSEEKGRRGRQPFRIAVRHGAVVLGPALQPRLGEPVAHTERGCCRGRRACQATCARAP